MSRFALLTLAFTLILLSPAQAVEINDEGATRLKTLFTKTIDDYIKLKEIASAIGKTEATDDSSENDYKYHIELDGEVMVEQAATYYAVTLPLITAYYPLKTKLEIGLIAINAVPTDNPDNWKLSIALPTSIIYSDEKNNPLVSLNIGSQKMGGLWNGKLEDLSQMIGRYKDITFINHKDGKILSVKQVDISKKFSEDKEKKWSGHAKTTLSGLSFGDADYPKTVSIKEIVFSGTAKDVNPLTQNKLLSMLENKENIAASFFKSFGKQAASQITIKGLTVNTTTAKKKGQQMSLETFTLASSIENEALINNSLHISYDGFSSSTKKTDYDSFFPTKIDIKISLKNLPIAKIIEIGQKAFAKSDKPQATQVVLLQTMMTLPKVLSEAGTTLHLTGNNIGTDQYNIDLQGSVLANSLSPFGATGDLTVKISGLQSIISTLKHSAQSASPEEAKKITATLQKVQMLDGISKADSNGQNVYKFTLDQQAHILMNNMDISALSGRAPK